MCCLHSRLLFGQCSFHKFGYADDVALLAHAMDDLHTALEVFEATASQLGLYDVLAETKIQKWVRAVGADQHPTY